MIPVSCDGCGRCCLNQSSPPFLPSELDAIPRELSDEIERYLGGPDFDDSRPCLWLDPETKRCRNYEHRPGVCRDYPLASAPCHAERKAVGLSVEGWPIVPDPYED